MSQNIPHIFGTLQVLIQDIFKSSRHLKRTKNGKTANIFEGSNRGNLARVLHELSLRKFSSASKLSKKTFSYIVPLRGDGVVQIIRFFKKNNILKNTNWVDRSELELESVVWPLSVIQLSPLIIRGGS